MNAKQVCVPLNSAHVGSLFLTFLVFLDMQRTEWRSAAESPLFRVIQPFPLTSRAAAEQAFLTGRTESKSYLEETIRQW